MGGQGSWVQPSCVTLFDSIFSSMQGLMRPWIGACAAGKPAISSFLCSMVIILCLSMVGRSSCDSLACAGYAPDAIRQVLQDTMDFSFPRLLCVPACLMHEALGCQVSSHLATPEHWVDVKINSIDVGYCIEAMRDFIWKISTILVSMYLRSVVIAEAFMPWHS